MLSKVCALLSFLPSFVINYPAHSLSSSLLLVTPAARKQVVFKSTLPWSPSHCGGPGSARQEVRKSFTKSWEAPHFTHTHTHTRAMCLTISNPTEWVGLQAGLAILSCVWDSIGHKKPSAGPDPELVEFILFGCFSVFLLTFLFKGYFYESFAGLSSPKSSDFHLDAAPASRCIFFYSRFMYLKELWMSDLNLNPSFLPP